MDIYEETHLFTRLLQQSVHTQILKVQNSGRDFASTLNSLRYANEPTDIRDIYLHLQVT
jgi:hypothetical protein